jgi:hypothetical protein
LASSQDEDPTASRMNQSTPLPTALLPTSRKEREKWGTQFVFSRYRAN